MLFVFVILSFFLLLTFSVVHFSSNQAKVHQTYLISLMKVTELL
jgi:hypothetical protein